MTESDLGNLATEDSGSVAVARAAVRASEIKQQGFDFLQSGRRDLSEEELSAPAVRRFLIAEIERLSVENGKLVAIRDLYYEAKTDLAVEREQSKVSRKVDLLSFVCLTAGSAGLGAAPSYFSFSSLGWVFFFIS